MTVLYQTTRRVEGSCSIGGMRILKKDCEMDVYQGEVDLVDLNNYVGQIQGLQNHTKRRKK